MSAIIGRIREQKNLQQLINSGEAQFVAIYGRRRVGKTYLIRTFCQDKGLYFEQKT